jgi:hypothetical protein
LRRGGLSAAWSLLALICVAGCGGEHADDDSRPVDAFSIEREALGINGHVLRALSIQGDVAALDTHLEAIADSEIAWVRANVDWVSLEPAAPEDGKHRFDFAQTDAWVRALAEHGLRWYAVGVGASTPAWAASPAAVGAGCGGRAPPADPGLTASMMAAVASRYGEEGSFWDEYPELQRLPVRDYEVWNEPNHGAFWCPAPSPVTYADHLLEAADAVRAQDPKARIVFGGLAPFHETTAAAVQTTAKMDAEEFLASVFGARPELAEKLSAVAVHTYGVPDLIRSDLDWFRAALDELGMEEMPLSLNEVGWPTAGGADTVPVPEAERVRYMREVIPQALRSNCLVSSLAPHTWITEESDPENPEDWFGIADPVSGVPYPSGAAYIEEARIAEADRHVGADEVSALC